MVKQVTNSEARCTIPGAHAKLLRCKINCSNPMITVTRHNSLHLGVNKKALKKGKGMNKAKERASFKL